MQSGLLGALTCAGILLVAAADAHGASFSLYEHTNYGGKAVNIHSNVPDMSRLRFNDKASSMRIGGGGIASLYEHSNYKGLCMTVKGDVRNFSGTVLGHDRVSSMILGRGCEVSVTLFEIPGYRGGAVQLRRDEPRLDRLRFNDRLSSLKSSGGRHALFEHYNYTGRCVEVRGNVPDIRPAGLANRSVSSIRLNQGCPIRPIPMGSEWEHVPGALARVWVGSDGVAWGLDREGKVQRWEGNGWAAMKQTDVRVDHIIIQQLSVAGFENVIGTRTNGEIIRWHRQGWKTRWHDYAFFAQAPDMTMWAIKKDGTVQRADGDWNMKDVRGPKLQEIAVGSKDHVWALTPQGDVLQWSGRAWQPRPSLMRQVTVGEDGQVWALNPSGDIFHYDQSGRRWVKHGGRFEHISAGGYGHVWGVVPGGAVFRLKKRHTPSGWARVTSDAELVDGARIAIRPPIWNSGSGDKPLRKYLTTRRDEIMRSGLYAYAQQVPDADSIFTIERVPNTPGEKYWNVPDSPVKAILRAENGTYLRAANRLRRGASKTTGSTPTVFMLVPRSDGLYRLAKTNFSYSSHMKKDVAGTHPGSMTVCISGSGSTVYHVTADAVNGFQSADHCAVELMIPK